MIKKSAFHQIVDPRYKFLRAAGMTYLISFFLLTACATGENIFPSAPVLTDVTSDDIPNPISMAVDEPNSQIIVVNSNVDFSFENGTIMTVSVNATDPESPELEVTSIVSTPNFGGQIAFDGTKAYVPFREASTEGDSDDQVESFNVTAGEIEGDVLSTTGENPFGIAVSASNVFVVCDDELQILNTDLDLVESVDLGQASEADIEEAEADHVENVAIDVAGNRAFISNRRGKILVVDLGSNEISHVIDGPTNTRGIAYDGVYLYAVDGNPPALWIFDSSHLSDPGETPDEMDDSTLLIDVIGLGSNPNGIAVDTANQRVYVANTSDKSVSVVDLVLMTEVARISLDDEDTDLTDVSEPFGIATGTFDGVPLIFVANISSNNIAVINANTLQVVEVFP